MSLWSNLYFVQEQHSELETHLFGPDGSYIEVHKVI